MLCVLILALDTCDARGGVALLRDASLLHTEPHATPEDYSSWLLPAIARTLAAGRITMRDVDLYAVTAGPGSFTGVRVSLTTVKAWSEVYGRSIAAVSRLDALAAEGTASAPYVAAFVDARRDQIFAALYRRQAERLERIDDEMVIAPDRFLEWCIAMAGPDPIAWVSTDPHCLAQTPQWSSRLARSESIQPVSPLLANRVGQIGYRLALQNQLTDALSLDANYVRRSDAELFWKGPSRHGAENKPVAATPWTVRRFQPGDSGAIMEILRGAAEASQWPAESYGTLSASPSGLLLVCETRAQVIGFLAARQVADEAEILNVAVHRDVRRQGAASALLHAALESFRRCAIACVFLELRASNGPARALYDRHGFVPSGIRKSYYRQPAEDAVCMRKKLIVP